MIKVRGVESLTLLIGLVAAEAMGSGVGVSYYMPSTPVPAGSAASCPTGGCAPVAGCNTCKRLGFACVDHASPPPCTAEGGCHPAGPFGFSQPRWRRWPGTEETGGAPKEAGDEDSLLPAYEEPAPEDEDKQAPPPLEDTAEEDPDDGPAPPAMNRPGREISLPPLPKPALPTPRPGGAAPEGDAPPSLPFGYNQPTTGGDSYGPPASPFRTTPTALPKPTADRDAPPPLPMGFTQTGADTMLRRLPTTAGRPAAGAVYLDHSVQPASAHLPMGR